MGLNHIFASQFLDKCRKLRLQWQDQSVTHNLSQRNFALELCYAGDWTGEGLKIWGTEQICGGHNLPPLVERGLTNQPPPRFRHPCTGCLILKRKIINGSEGQLEGPIILLIYGSQWLQEDCTFLFHQPVFKKLTSAGLNSLRQKEYQISVKYWIFDDSFHKKGLLFIIWVQGMIKPSRSVDILMK